INSPTIISTIIFENTIIFRPTKVKYIINNINVIIVMSLLSKKSLFEINILLSFLQSLYSLYHWAVSYFSLSFLSIGILAYISSYFFITSDCVKRLSLTLCFIFVKIVYPDNFPI